MTKPWGMSGKTHGLKGFHFLNQITSVSLFPVVFSFARGKLLKTLRPVIPNCLSRGLSRICQWSKTRAWAVTVCEMGTRPVLLEDKCAVDLPPHLHKWSRKRKNEPRELAREASRASQAPNPPTYSPNLSCAWLFFKYFECRNTPRLLSLLELDFHTPATLPFFPASQSRVFCLPTTWFNSREGPFLCCILSTDISGCLEKGSRDLGGAAKEVQNTLMSHSCKVRGFQRGARARCGGSREAW